MVTTRPAEHLAKHAASALNFLPLPPWWRGRLARVLAARASRLRPLATRVPTARPTPSGIRDFVGWDGLPRKLSGLSFRYAAGMPAANGLSENRSRNTGAQQARSVLARQFHNLPASAMNDDVGDPVGVALQGDRWFRTGGKRLGLTRWVCLGCSCGRDFVRQEWSKRFGHLATVV
jgi:hypothetical protein